MKFCAVICEYNPFHNGHLYQFREIARQTEDPVLCLMSGGFTQRGDAAVLHKRERAKHAVLAGADVVLELPAAFAVSPAELFAGGAIRILASIPAVKELAFGCESGDREKFLAAGRALGDEDKRFRALLKENMRGGVSYVRARAQTALALNPGLDASLLSSPNNILGTEYCRALFAEKSAISPMPILRAGGGYSDQTLLGDLSSAAAIRAALADGSKKAVKGVRKNVPDAVFADLGKSGENVYKRAAMCALAAATPEELARVPDCSEGLENRLKILMRSNPDYDGLLSKAVSKRYTLSRIKRILLQNFLRVNLKDVRSYLASPLYYSVLAVKKKRADEVFSALSEGSFPLLARRSDLTLLKRDAAACFETDVRANDLYNAITGMHTSDFDPVFVD